MRPDDLIWMHKIYVGFSPDICNVLEYVRSYYPFLVVGENTRFSVGLNVFLCLEYRQLLTIFVYLCTTAKYLQQYYDILWNVYPQEHIICSWYPHSINIVHSCRVIRVFLDMDALLIFAKCLKSKKCNHQLQIINLVFGLIISPSTPCFLGIFDCTPSFS